MYRTESGSIDQAHGRLNDIVLEALGPEYVRTPLLEASSGLLAAESAPAISFDYASCSSCRRMAPRILVVDDDDHIRRLECKVLERCGYQVEQASDGQAAIDLIDGDGYRAIVLDLMMPKVDGLGVIEHLAKTNPTLITRTVIATAFPREANKHHQLGVCRVIVKPFDIQELITAVNECAHESTTPTN